MSTDHKVINARPLDRWAHRARSLTGKIASSILLILLWLLFLALGNSLQSSDYSPQNTDNLRNFLGHIILYVVSWTWTNVGVLACVAAALGESGRDILSYPRSDYRRAVVRGFFAYLVVTVGYMVGQGGLNLVDVHPTLQASDSDSWVQSMSRFTYARIAITVSMAGFLAGYSPDYIKNWLTANRSHEQPPVSKESEGEPKKPAAAEHKTVA